MEQFYSCLVIFGAFGLIALGVMTILLPVYVYQIRNRVISINKKMGVMVKLLKSNTHSSSGLLGK